MDDVAKYLTLFVSEASDHAEQLARGCPALTDGEFQAERVDELFRHAHSIKGMSAAMGFDELVTLAHAAEHLLGELRQRKVVLPPPGGRLLLEASDRLLSMIRRRGRGEEAPEAAELAGALRATTLVQPGATAQTSDSARLAAAADPGEDGDGADSEGLEVRAVRERLRGARVGTALLDALLEGAGETLTEVARLREQVRSLPGARSTWSSGPAGLPAALPAAGLSSALAPALASALEEGLDRLQRQLRELHGQVTQARLTALAVLTSQLPRHVREIARRTGREVELQVAGAEVEIDRGLVEELADVLLHLLRNCVDHGIEPADQRRALGKPAVGLISVQAQREGETLRLAIADDGRGFDPAQLRAAAVRLGRLSAEAAAALTPEAALRLACLPGVSTARQVTEISGRGIGLDAVLSAVEGLGGTLAIASATGLGARFTIRLPLSLALMPVLLAEVAGEVVALPIAKVQAAVDLPPAGRPLEFAGRQLPVESLGQLLGFEAQHRASGPGLALVVGEGGEEMALAVDRLVGQQEAVVKPLSRPLDQVAGLSGVTLLGSGQPVFILEVARLRLLGKD